jgi:hypothetical protein
MDEIRLRTNIERGDFYEFYAGVFNDNHWHKDSVFLQDEVFHYIEPTISKHAPNLDWYGPTRIPREIWVLIIEDLEGLYKAIEKAIDAEQLEGLIRFVATETGKTEFVQGFDINKRALQIVIHDLVEWLQRKLEHHSTVWVLGI